MPPMSVVIANASRPKPKMLRARVAMVAAPRRANPATSFQALGLPFSCFGFRPLRLSLRRLLRSVSVVWSFALSIYGQRPGKAEASTDA